MQLKMDKYSEYFNVQCYNSFNLLKKTPKITKPNMCQSTKKTPYGLTVFKQIAALPRLTYRNRPTSISRQTKNNKLFALRKLRPTHKTSHASSSAISSTSSSSSAHPNCQKSANRQSDDRDVHSQSPNTRRHPSIHPSRRPIWHP